MGLQDSVSAERIHISFFGKRNAGKSSMVNAITGQQFSVVSAVKGTTTDPVKRAMELLPLGPVVIIDTPGLDDEGELGSLRVKKARQVLEQTDIAVLVVDKTEGMSVSDEELVKELEERKIPYLLVYNKIDLPFGEDIHKKDGVLYASAHTGEGIEKVKEALGAFAKENRNEIQGYMPNSYSFSPVNHLSTSVVTQYWWTQYMLYNAKLGRECGTIWY